MSENNKSLTAIISEIMRTSTEPALRELHQKLLSPSGMKEGRVAVIGAYEWFTHARIINDFEEIKANGIPLAWPEAAIAPRELLESNHLDKKIICLSVFPKNSTLHLNKGGNSVFKMALHSDDLPPRVGIDCTFGNTYEEASAFHARQPTPSLGDVFLNSVKSREVVITFDPILPSSLRVCIKADPTAHPAKWPRLIDTAQKDVASFDADTMGNVAL